MISKLKTIYISSKYKNDNEIPEDFTYEIKEIWNHHELFNWVWISWISIPRSFYIINKTNNKFSLYIGTTFYEKEIPIGDYTQQEFFDA